MSNLSPEAQLERKRRIQLSVWAYAYELLDHSIVDDYRYDAVARQSDTFIETGNDELDLWWMINFDPSTGVWVHKHPHKERLREICLGITEHETTKGRKP